MNRLAEQKLKKQEAKISEHFRWILVAKLCLFIFGVLSFSGMLYYRYHYSQLTSTEANLKLEKEQVERLKLISKLKKLEKSVKRIQLLAKKIKNEQSLELPQIKGSIGPLDVDQKLDKFRKYRLSSLQESLPNFHIDNVVVDVAESDNFYQKLMQSAQSLGVFNDKLELNLNALYSLNQDKFLFWNSSPSTWPVKGVVTSEYGVRRHPYGGLRMHKGIDIAAPHGTRIYAPSKARVLKASYQGGYGNTVLLDHGNGIVTKYAHASDLLVSEGQEVKRGQEIALVGSTGASTGPHLHYEVRIDNVPVDPKYFTDNHNKVNQKKSFSK